MYSKITNDKPEHLTNVGGDRLANFEEWIAHKQLCRQMFEEAELSMQVSREDYLARLDSVVAHHKKTAKGHA